jgi:uncharacterized membrane protein YfcA
MGYILLFSIIIGGFIGSKLVLDKKYELSKKTIHYITSILGFIIGITFLITGLNE